MALSILDGTQTATTLSTILSSGQHITAHTVVSLGTQAITDIVNATSAGLTNTQLRASAVTVGGTVTVGNSVTVSSLPAISGTVTANLDPNASVIASQIETGIQSYAADLSNDPLPIYGTVTIGSALPAGTNQIGSVTASGTVTANIGGIANSVTLPVRLNAEKFGEAPSGQDTLVVCNSSGMLLVDANSGGSSVLGFDGNAFVQIKPVSGSSVTIGNSVTIGSLPAISGTVTANGGDGTFLVGGLRSGGKTALQLDAGTGYLQTKVESLPSLVAGTAQIGSVTASISNSLTISSLPAISGTVTASVSNFSSIASDGGGNAPPIGIQLGFSAGEEDYRLVDPSNPLPVTASGTVTANTFALQGTAVTTSNFTSTTASTVLAGFNATREVLTIFNEGAGNLHICAGATCTTIAYQVRLSAGDYYEVPNHQTTITHSAVFATAGTARIVQIS